MKRAFSASNRQWTPLAPLQGAMDAQRVGVTVPGHQSPRLLQPWAEVFAPVGGDTARNVTTSALALSGIFARLAYVLAQGAKRIQPRAERSDALGQEIHTVLIASRPEGARETPGQRPCIRGGTQTSHETRLESELATVRAKMQAYLEELGV